MAELVNFSSVFITVILRLSAQRSAFQSAVRFASVKLPKKIYKLKNKKTNNFYNYLHTVGFRIQKKVALNPLLRKL